MNELQSIALCLKAKILALYKQTTDGNLDDPIDLSHRRIFPIDLAGFTPSMEII